jgi:hypothetical protein
LRNQPGWVPSGSGGADAGRAQIGHARVGGCLLHQRSHQTRVGEHVQFRGDPRPQRRLQGAGEDVHVRVDQAGQDRATAGVDHRHARRRGQPEVERGDAPLQDHKYGRQG